MINEGVHRTHCCVFHGCKYGNEYCPVVNKTVKQDYICEDCDYEGITIDMLDEYYHKIKNEEKKMNKNEMFQPAGSGEPTVLDERIFDGPVLDERIFDGPVFDGMDIFENFRVIKPEDNTEEVSKGIKELFNIVNALVMKSKHHTECLPVPVHVTERLPVPVPVNERLPVPVRKKKVKVVKKKYDDDIKFSYYGCVGECNHHNGVMVIATVVNRKHSVVHYGVAYCSPNDVYNKETGKHIAYSDLVNNMNTVALGKVTHHDINARIFADIVAFDDAPSWAKNPVAIALVQHLKRAFNMKGVA